LLTATIRAGIWSADAAPPGASAKGARVVKKFEYPVAPIYHAQQATDKIESILNDFGERGWELATTCQKPDSSVFFVFKRPKD
jgi:hypothetical protein